MSKIWFLLPLLIFAALVLVACAGERYPAGSPPHESWKSRGEYCFAVEVDPRGDKNSTYFWSDDVAVTDDAGASIIKARNARVSTSNRDFKMGNSKNDYFQVGIVEVVEDGSISIEERCFEE